MWQSSKSKLCCKKVITSNNLFWYVYVPTKANKTGEAFYKDFYYCLKGSTILVRELQVDFYYCLKGSTILVRELQVEFYYCLKGSTILVRELQVVMSVLSINMPKTGVCFGHNWAAIRLIKNIEVMNKLIQNLFWYQR